jgi:hypothetical protein
MEEEPRRQIKLQALEAAMGNMKKMVALMQERTGVDLGITEDKWRIDENSYELVIGRAGDKFYFKGKIGEVTSLNLPEVPIIRDITIPEEIRGDKWGRTLIASWEDTMFKMGYRFYIVSNPKLGMVGFWQSCGYEIPETDKDKGNSSILKKHDSRM